MEHNNSNSKKKKCYISILGRVVPANRRYDCLTWHYRMQVRISIRWRLVHWYRYDARAVHFIAAVVTTISILMMIVAVIIIIVITVHLANCCGVKAVCIAYSEVKYPWPVYVFGYHTRRSLVKVVMGLCFRRWTVTPTVLLRSRRSAWPTSPWAVVRWRRRMGQWPATRKVVPRRRWV